MRIPMRQYCSKNGLTTRTNRIIGRVAYFVVHSLIFMIAYRIWDGEMFNEPWLYIMHISAFYLVRVLLLMTGVWVY